MTMDAETWLCFRKVFGLYFLKDLSKLSKSKKKSSLKIKSSDDDDVVYAKKRMKKFFTIHRMEL